MIGGGHHTPNHTDTINHALLDAGADAGQTDPSPIYCCCYGRATSASGASMPAHSTRLRPRPGECHTCPRANIIAVGKCHRQHAAMNPVLAIPTAATHTHTHMHTHAPQTHPTRSLQIKYERQGSDFLDGSQERQLTTHGCADLGVGTVGPSPSRTTTTQTGENIGVVTANAAPYRTGGTATTLNGTGGVESGSSSGRRLCRVGPRPEGRTDASYHTGTWRRCRGVGRCEQRRGYGRGRWGRG